MMATNSAVIAVVSAVLLVGVAAGGVAALPADVPEQAADQASNASANETERDVPTDASPAHDEPGVAIAAQHANASIEAANASDGNATVDPASMPDEASQRSANDDRPGSVGPPDGLPEQVPDRVATIHETIESFLDGTVERLGTQLSQLLGSDDAGPDAE